jgi:type IV pilus assembly protein PilA
MNPKLLTACSAVLALLLVGCGKKETAAGDTKAPTAATAAKAPTAELVAPSQQSRHFHAVNRQLQLGGTLYGYVDVDGDAMKLAGGLKDLLENVGRTKPELGPFINQDYAAIFTKLGLNDVKAMGVSSVPDGSGFFSNRVFFYTPDGRHGLLAGLGGKPAPFAHVSLAPANTDIYSETEIDVPAVYLTLKDVIGQIGGEAAKNQFEAAIQKAGEKAMVSWLKLINATKGHVVLVGRFDANKTMKLPGRDGMTLPAFSFLLRIDGVADALEGIIRDSGMFTPGQTTDSTRVYEFSQQLPVGGLRPAIVIQGSTLFFATTMDFMNECRTQKANLGQDPEFQKAVAHVGTEGNGLGYISPRAFQRLRDLETLNPNLPPDAKAPLNYILSKLPNTDRPLVTVRVNSADGILVRSYWNRSLKQDMAVMTVYNPVTIGVMAAMAIPAFQKTRMAAQEKAVMNNLRQLAAAADQFYLEKGVNRATYGDLVGQGKYIRAINPVAGEDYRALRFQSGQPLQVRLPNGQVVRYGP